MLNQEDAKQLINVKVNVWVPEGATHFSESITDDPVFYKTKDTGCGYNQWLYYEGGKGWLLSGIKEPWCARPIEDVKTGAEVLTDITADSTVKGDGLAGYVGTKLIFHGIPFKYSILPNFLHTFQVAPGDRDRLHAIVADVEAIKF